MRRSPLLWWAIGALVTAACLTVSVYCLTRSTRLVTSYETVPFQVVKQPEIKLLEGVEFIKKQGRTGTRQVRTKVWVDGDGSVTRRKVVWRRVLTPAQPEVILTGKRSQSDTAADVTAVSDRFVADWRAGDYDALVALCDQDTFAGRSFSTIKAACEAAGERVTDAQLDAPVVAGMQQQLLVDSGEADATLVPTDFPAGAAAIASVAGTVTTASTTIGPQTHDGIRLAYRAGGWRVVYQGPLGYVSVRSSQRYSADSWGQRVVGQVTLDGVFVYADRVALVVGESNLTSTKDGLGSLDTEFRDLSWSDTPLLADDSPEATAYSVDTQLSSTFSSLDEGASQRGVIWLTPAPPADATSLTVRLPDVTFSGIKVR
jgi:hypothetical protein